MKGGVFIGPAQVVIQERETTAVLSGSQRVLLFLSGTAPAFPFGVREKIVQRCRHRSHQFPRPCQTFATQHIS